MKILGISSGLIYKCWKLYTEKNYQGLKIKKRGVKLGTSSKLSIEQMNTLKQTLIGKTPDEFKLGFSLWTRKAIQNFIFKLWKIHISLSTVSRYMKKLGFTP